MAKKSRRARRQQAQKQPQSFVQETPIEASEPEVAPEPTPEDRPMVSHKAVNFAQEYFYVYVDLRNILIVAALMVAVLIGLSFVI